MSPFLRHKIESERWLRYERKVKKIHIFQSIMHCSAQLAKVLCLINNTHMISMSEWKLLRNYVERRVKNFTHVYQKQRKKSTENNKYLMDDIKMNSQL